MLKEFIGKHCFVFSLYCLINPWQYAIVDPLFSLLLLPFIQSRRIHVRNYSAQSSVQANVLWSVLPLSEKGEGLDFTVPFSSVVHYLQSSESITAYDSKIKTDLYLNPATFTFDSHFNMRSGSNPTQERNLSNWFQQDFVCATWIRAHRGSLPRYNLRWGGHIPKAVAPPAPGLPVPDPRWSAGKRHQAQRRLRGPATFSMTPFPHWL